MTGKNRKSELFRSGVLFLILIATLLLVSPDAVQGRSLYVIANINASPSPIRAYDIQDDTLVYQATYYVPSYAGGAVGLAIDSDAEYLFVTYENSNVIQLVDAKTMTSAGSTTAPGAGNLAGIVVDHDKNKVYTVDRSTNHLYVYSWDATNKILTNDVTASPYYIPLSGVSRAHGIALDEFNDLLYLCDLTTTIKIFNTADWSSAGNITLGQGQGAMAVAVDVKRGYVYTGNAYPGYGSLGLLSQYDLNTNTEKTVNISTLTHVSSDNVVGIAVDQTTGVVYITTGDQGYGGSDKIVVFDKNLNELAGDSSGDIGDPTGVCVPIADVSYNPLNLSKDHGISDGLVAAGEEITYQICFDNPNTDRYVNLGSVANDDSDAEYVTLLDHLPLEVDFVSAGDGGQYDSSSHTVSWGGTIEAGASQKCVQLKVKVQSDVPVDTEIINSVTIDSENTPPTTTTCTATVTEKSKPEPVQQYFLLAQVIGGNGTVVPTGGLYTHGDVVNLLATPAVGYAVKAWTGTNNNASTGNSNAVTMNGPKNVTVEFFALPVICQLTTSVDSGSGTITPVPGVHSYNYGEQVTLTAQPDTGWLVQSWIQDGVAHPTEATSYMVSMDTNKTVAVSFAAVPVTLTTAVIAGNGTIIPASGQHIYGMGITVEATAQPATGWRVKSWTENGVLHTTTDTTYSVVMDGDKTLDVVFEPEQYTLTTSVAGGSGTINPAPGTYTYDSGTVVTVAAAPGQYSQVQSWTENGSVYTATDTSYVVTMNSDKAVAVSFQQQPVELSYDIIAGNGVIPQTSGLYSMGMTVPLSVTPAEGYCVRAWSGTNDDSSTATTNAVFMDSDKEVTVELAAVVDTEKCRITLGRSSTVGTLQVSGNFTATQEELASAQAVYIRIWSPSGFDFPADPIDFDDDDVKNGKYNYSQNIGKGDPADISSFKFDLNKGTFSLQIKNLDMAGMMNPIYADIEIGDYVGVAQICEDAADGGYVPVSLSQGQADQLHSRKACVTKGKQEQSDTLVLLGDIALAQPDVDLTDVDVNITWCDLVFTIPAGSFKVIKGTKYGCTNANISPSGTATATIDLGAGTYSITLRKVSITQCQCCTATLGISFAGFSETVELHSQQAN
jgi:hypothetical protein